MNVKRIFGALSAFLSVGATVAVIVAPSASAAVTLTTTNCAGVNGATFSYSFTGLAVGDKVDFQFVTSGGSAHYDDFAIAVAPTFSATKTLGTDLLLPVPASGTISGIFSVVVNGGSQSLTAFSVSSCLGMRRAVIDKNVVGVPAIGTKFILRVNNAGLGALDLDYPTSGGTYTVPLSGATFDVIENSSGNADSHGLFDVVRSLPGSDDSHISIPGALTNEHVVVTNVFDTRPVTVNKVWKDVNGKTLTAAQEPKVLSNIMTLQVALADGLANPIGYSADLPCSLVSCPIFDVPPKAGIKIVAESDASGYTPVSSFQYLTGCGPKANVGSSEFPDFQWPPCSVTFVNQAQVVPASTTTTTTTLAATTTTTPTSSTTTTTLPDVTTTTTPTTTTAPLNTSTTTTAPVVTTTSTTLAPPTATTTTLQLKTSTTLALSFPTIPTIPPSVSSATPTLTTSPPTILLTELVPGTTVARLIVDAATAKLPIPPAPAPATPLLGTTPAYTGAPSTMLLLLALALLSGGAAILVFLAKQLQRNE